jgi:hypothetical protein
VLVDRDVAFLHALEQAGLRLRRRPVDLVDEHDVREHRARPELEAVLALVVDVGADNVRRQQIRGALDARVFGLDRARQRSRERRLADSRIVLDQHVTLGEQGDEHIAKHLLRGLHGAGDVVPQPRTELGHLLRVELRDGRHAPPS